MGDFCQNIQFLQGLKAKLFVERQESVRKNVERAFDVLSQFAIVRGPSRLLEEKEIDIMMRVCATLRNMIMVMNTITTSLHLATTLSRRLH